MVPIAQAVIDAYRSWKAGKSPFTDLENALEALTQQTVDPVAAAMPLTTGQVAVVLGIAPRTAQLLIDSGKIRTWKVRRDRRVCPKSLRAFMEAEGIPIEPLHTFLLRRSLTPTDQGAPRVHLPRKAVRA